MIAEFRKKSDETEFNLTDMVMFKLTLISDVLSTIKEKLHILTGRIKKDVLQTRPNPPKSPPHENAKLFGRMELKQRRLINGIYIQH